MSKFGVSISLTLVAAMVMLELGVGQAVAMQNNRDAGIQACVNWCVAHNKTDNSQRLCAHNCITYYCFVAKPPAPICTGGAQAATLSLLPLKPGTTTSTKPGRFNPPPAALTAH